MKPPDSESVFDIVERLVKPVAVLAEMLKVGDADQARQHELSKYLLASLLDLGEELDMDDLDAEVAAMQLAGIIYSFKDYVSASATAISDRKSSSEAMDVYADENATAIFITRNMIAYGTNHEPTVRAFNDKVNLKVLTAAARKQKETRVRELINALYEGIENRGDS